MKMIRKLFKLVFAFILSVTAQAPPEAPVNTVCGPLPELLYENWFSKPYEFCECMVTELYDSCNEELLATNPDQAVQVCGLRQCQMDNVCALAFYCVATLPEPGFTLCDTKGIFNSPDTYGGKTLRNTSNG